MFVERDVSENDKISRKRKKNIVKVVETPLKNVKKNKTDTNKGGKKKTKVHKSKSSKLDESESAVTSESAKSEVKEDTDILNMLLPNPDNFADDDFQDGGNSDDDSDDGNAEFIESMATLAGGQKKQIFASGGFLTGANREINKEELAMRKLKKAENEKNKNDDNNDDKEKENAQSLATDNIQSKLLSLSGTESSRFLAVPQSTIHNSDESAKSADKPEYAKFEMKEGTDILNMLLPNPDNFADDDFQDGGYSDDDSDDGNAEFIESMATLAGGQKKQIFASRGSTVLTSADSENKVNMDDLIGSLDKGTKEMSKRAEMGIQSTAKTLAAPLHRQAEEKINRDAGYQRVRQELNVWDNIVQNNREEDTMKFPLVEPDLAIKTAAETVKTRFLPETPLEIQIAQMLASSQSTIQPGEELTPLEKKALEGLTKEELRIRRSELARFRMLRSNQMKKIAHQNKIKSKSYRKLVRKIKTAEKVKELERMAEEDPEAAAYEIEKIERRRILERATLKHRNASKHMSELAKRAKLSSNKDVVRAVQRGLRENIDKHRELTAKTKVVSDSEDEAENKTDSEEEKDDKEDESYNDFASSYRKYWEAKQLEQATAAKKMSAQDEIEDMFDEASFARKQALAMRKLKEAENEKNKNDDKDDVKDNEEDKELENAQSVALDKTQSKLLSISGTNSRRVHAVPQSTIHNSDEELETDDGKQNNADKTADENKDSDATKPRKAEVDPDDFIQVKPKKLKTSLPEISGYNEDADSDDDTEQRQMIAEAFADDDVLEDFRKEKEAIIEASKAKDVDKFLPGWGSWAGTGLAKKEERFRKRFLQKAPPPEKRRDENKVNLIINTDKDKILPQHLVNRLPRHFNNVSDFEASIRAPIGNTFVPRSAHLQLIQPRVQTKMGTTIEPMDRTVMYNKNQQLLEEIKLFKGQELSDDEEGKEGGRRKFKGKGKPSLKS